MFCSIFISDRRPGAQSIFPLNCSKVGISIYPYQILDRCSVYIFAKLFHSWDIDISISDRRPVPSLFFLLNCSTVGISIYPYQIQDRCPVYIFRQCLSLSQTSPFLCVFSTGLLKTMWEKEKLLVTSNFHFSHSVFHPFGELSAIFIKFRSVVCKLFQFGRV